MDGSYVKNETKMSEIISASCALICCLDKQHKITYLSPAWQHILNHPLEGYYHQLFTTLLVKSNEPKIQGLLVSWTDNKECVKRFVCELNTINGVRSYEFIGQSSLGRDDCQLIFNAHDITEKEALREERDMLAYAIDESSAGICLTDKNRLVIWTNNAFEKLTGYTQHELMGQTLSKFLQGENTDQEVVQHIRAQLQAGKGVQTDILNYSKSGEAYWCRLLITPIFRGNEVINFIGFQQNVTAEIEAIRALEDVNTNLEHMVEKRTLELSKANAKLERLSRYDALTNTLNRRVFYEIYETECARLTRNKSYLSVAMIDVDHFKVINDTLGHLAGDNVLQVLVNEINGIKRDSDYLFRFGGEEFILLMPGNNLSQSKILAERIRQRIANLVVHSNDCDISITVSMGLIAINKEEAASDSLKKVDTLLYQAKSNGRNCTVY